MAKGPRFTLRSEEIGQYTLWRYVFGLLDVVKNERLLVEFGIDLQYCCIVAHTIAVVGSRPDRDEFFIKPIQVSFVH